MKRICYLRIVVFALLLSWVGLANAQLAYRLKANILTKTRLPDSTFQISKGKIHYDKNFKKIIFDFTFPEKEKVVLFDTLMYRYNAGGFVEKSRNFLIPEQSIFHFVLSENLSNFGFDEANFVARGIERKKDMVLTTWIPPEGLLEYLSKIMVASKNKQLYSITIFDKDSKVINRQILKDYHLIDGLYIPCEILIATYLDQGTMFQIIELDEVEINETANNENYDHTL